MHACTVVMAKGATVSAAKNGATGVVTKAGGFFSAPPLAPRPRAVLSEREHDNLFAVALGTILALETASTRAPCSTGCRFRGLAPRYYPDLPVGLFTHTCPDEWLFPQHKTTQCYKRYPLVKG
jgi:hypothetical protein